MPPHLPLLLQVTTQAADALRQQGAQTGEMLRDYGALVNLLYLLAIGGGITTAGLAWWTIRRGETVVNSIQTAASLLVTPLQDSQRATVAELKEKHAQEIRANETHHQAQLSALVEQLKLEREDRRKLTDTANNAYKEMNEIVQPFTRSNNALAQRMHDMEQALHKLRYHVTGLATPADE